MSTEERQRSNGGLMPKNAADAWALVYVDVAEKIANDEGEVATCDASKPNASQTTSNQHEQN